MSKKQYIPFYDTLIKGPKVIGHFDSELVSFDFSKKNPSGYKLPSEYDKLEEEYLKLADKYTELADKYVVLLNKDDNEEEIRAGEETIGAKRKISF